PVCGRSRRCWRTSTRPVKLVRIPRRTWDRSGEARRRVPLGSRHLPSANPFRQSILLTHQLPDLILRPRNQFLLRLPCCLQSTLQLFPWESQIAKEVPVGSARAIFRLPWRQAQVASDASDVEGVQQGAMVQQVAALALLGVTRKLAAAEGQVADPCP